MPAGRAVAQEIEFLTEAFDERVAALGHVTDADKARFLNMDHGHYWRVSRGQKRPGEVFVTRVLGAPWPTEVKFEDFFRLRDAAQ